MSPSSALANSTFSGPCQLARSVARVTFPVTPPRDAAICAGVTLPVTVPGGGPQPCLASSAECPLVQVTEASGVGVASGVCSGDPEHIVGVWMSPRQPPPLRPRKEDGHPQREQSRQTDWKRCPLALGARISLTRCLWCVPAGGRVPSVCTAFRSRFSAFILWVLGIKPGSPALSVS